MIDYDKPDDDPIVAEVRRAREEYASKFNFDLHLIFEDLKRQQEEAVRMGRKYATPPPRQPTESTKMVG